MESTVGLITNQAINTGTDSVDYDKAFQVLSRANGNPDCRQFIYEVIETFVFRGARREKINGITFIDFLFKNASKSFLSDLMKSHSILNLKDDESMRDPYCHHLIMQLAPEWAQAASKANVLTREFLSWVEEITSYEYKFKLTPAAGQKFKRDFAISLQLLNVFAQNLLSDLETHNFDNETISEIFPNVIEIENRLKELKPTMPDEGVVALIDYILDFCEISKQCYRDFTTTMVFNKKKLQNIVARIPHWALNPEATQPPAQIQPKPVVDDLLDFSNIPVQQNSSKKVPTDELIDFTHE